MKTKNFYLSLSLFSSFFCGTLALADVEASTSTPSIASRETFSGFYLMGSAGHSSLSVPRKGHWQVGPTTFQTGNDFFSNAAIFQGGVGYGHLFDDVWMMAVEAHGSWDGHQAKANSNTNTNGVNLSLSEELRKKFGWGVKAKLGYLVRENICAYMGVGVEHSSFTYKYASDAPQSGQKSQKLWGISPLVGMRVATTERLSLDFGYSHTFYENMSINQTNGTRQLSRSLKPRHSVAHIGLSYKIN